MVQGAGPDTQTVLRAVACSGRFYLAKQYSYSFLLHPKLSLPRFSLVPVYRHWASATLDILHNQTCFPTGALSSFPT